MSVEFLSAIIEHVAHPIFVKNASFEFVLVNRALCDMVGYRRDQLIGHTDYDFFPNEQADFFRRKDREMFSTESTISIDEERMTDSEGEVHILQTIKVPYRENGNVTHLVGIVNDVTKVKEAEATLRDAKAELERRVEQRTEQLRLAHEELVRNARLAALGQLAGGVAHQLRNPLGAIRNAVSLLSHSRLTASESEAFRIICEEVSRSDRIIHDLLDYARVRTPRRTRTELRGLIGEALRSIVVPHQITQRVAIADNLYVDIDPSQVEIALGNIMRNAIEAMPAGGTLSITAERKEGVVALFIEDTGTGVVAGTPLFDPLVTTKEHGVGLGLSIARNLIETQGGSVDLNRTSPEGTTFRIVLPASL